MGSFAMSRGTSTTIAGVTIEIAGMPIRLETQDASFRRMLKQRYGPFVNESAKPGFHFDIHLLQKPGKLRADDDLQVRMQAGRWLLRRGDFQAEWDSVAGRGRILQAPGRYAIDSVLRIIHTLIQASRGGFLLHAASAIRDHRAFLFSGVSGAGKTTISRLAPPDVTLLTDEISYLGKDRCGYRACGTPFAGELGRIGENVSAPVAALFFLAKGPKNRIDAVGKAEAIRLLLRNILFFAEDADLVRLVFQSACEFVDQVPVHRLTFFPDQRVWQYIGRISEDAA
jgi:hypothetical protein